jgi:hypothetical protein
LDEKNFIEKLKTKYKNETKKLVECITSYILNDLTSSQYFSLFKMKDLLDNNQIHLKDKYIEFLFYFLKKFDDPEAKLEDLKYSLFNEIVPLGDTTVHSKAFVNKNDEEDNDNVDLDKIEHLVNKEKNEINNDDNINIEENKEFDFDLDKYKENDINIKTNKTEPNREENLFEKNIMNKKEEKQEKKELKKNNVQFDNGNIDIEADIKQENGKKVNSDLYKDFDDIENNHDKNTGSQNNNNNIEINNDINDSNINNKAKINDNEDIKDNIESNVEKNIFKDIKDLDNSKKDINSQEKNNRTPTLENQEINQKKEENVDENDIENDKDKNSDKNEKEKEKESDNINNISTEKLIKNQRENTKEQKKEKEKEKEKEQKKEKAKTLTNNSNKSEERKNKFNESENENDSVTEITNEDFIKHIKDSLNSIQNALEENSLEFINFIEDNVRKIKIGEKFYDYINIEDLNDKFIGIKVVLSDMQLSCLCSKYSLPDELRLIDVKNFEKSLRDFKNGNLKLL